MSAEAQRRFVLPTSVVEPSDMLRVTRELDSLDDFFREAALRKSGSQVSLPRMTKGLRDVGEANELNFLEQADREKASRALQKLQTAAPIVHISFAADPSAEFVGKIVLYLRQNFHPYLLVQIGLQPSIAAGCTIRTTNKYFDLSLRQHLLKSRHLLIEALTKLEQAPAPAAPQSAIAAPVQPAAPTQPSVAQNGARQ